MEPDVTPHLDYLRSYAACLAPRGSDAEDLLQEARLLAHEKSLRFDHPGQIVNWYRRTIAFKALEAARRSRALVDRRDPVAEDPGQSTEALVELAHQARLLFEAVPRLKINEAAAFLLNLNESRSLAELARHFPLTRGRTPRFVSESTLKRRFRAIRECVRMYVEGRLPSQDVVDSGRDAAKALAEAVVFTGEREIVPDNPHAGSAHARLVGQLEAFTSLFPEQEDQLLCSRAVLNDHLRDQQPDNEVVRADNQAIIERLRDGSVSVHEPGLVAWVWYNHLLSELRADSEVQQDWKDLLAYIDRPDVGVNDELRMNIIHFASGWEEAYRFAEDRILSRKGPHSPSLILHVTAYLLRRREPRRARQLIETLPDEGLAPEYVAAKREAVEFCRSHHSNRDYVDADLPDWAVY